MPDGGERTVTIELSMAPPVHETIVLLQNAASELKPLPISVAAVVERRRIYFRLRWNDQSQDVAREINAFTDGAAIEIPMTAGDTGPTMGMPDKPVMIWRW